jgi:hypothetical protein
MDERDQVEKGRNDIKMERKAITTMMMFAFLALTLVSVQAVSAKTIKCDHVIYFNDWGVPGPLHPETTMYWKGPVTGGITGTVYFWETERNFYPGKTEHYFEDFYIELDGGWVSGHDEGVWNFGTCKYRATGRITDASPSYAYLVGNKIFEEGRTTNPFDEQGKLVLPIIGTGTGFIGP